MFVPHEMQNCFFKMSKVVKLMLMATGPFTQFMLSPLNSPRNPCSFTIDCNGPSANDPISGQDTHML